MSLEDIELGNAIANVATPPAPRLLTPQELRKMLDDAIEMKERLRAKRIELGELEAQTENQEQLLKEHAKLFYSDRNPGAEKLKYNKPRLLLQFGSTNWVLHFTGEIERIQNVVIDE